MRNSKFSENNGFDSNNNFCCQITEILKTLLHWADENLIDFHPRRGGKSKNNSVSNVDVTKWIQARICRLRFLRIVRVGSEFKYNAL